MNAAGQLDFTVVIPVWNEARRVAAGVQGYLQLAALLAGSSECVVVDDGSSDGTADVVAAMGIEGVSVLRAPHRGKGAAAARGVGASRGRRIVVVDVDWSIAPRQVAELVAVQADLVYASREGQGARRIAEPSWRHLLGRGFNAVVQHVLLAGVEDSQCGCKVFRREVALDIFPRLTVVGWAFDVEVLTVAFLLGYTVREVPTVWRHEGDSRVRPAIDGVAMLRDVLRIRRNLDRGRYSTR